MARGYRIRPPLRDEPPGISGQERAARYEAAENSLLHREPHLTPKQVARRLEANPYRNWRRIWGFVLLIISLCILAGGLTVYWSAQHGKASPSVSSSPGSSSSKTPVPDSSSPGSPSPTAGTSSPGSVTAKGDSDIFVQLGAIGALLGGLGSVISGVAALRKSR